MKIPSLNKILSIINDAIWICLLSLINVQIISSSSLLFPTTSYLLTSQYQPVVNKVSPPLTENQTTSNLQPLTNGWTPVITKRNGPQPTNSVYMAINSPPTEESSPSSSNIITKVVPLVAPIESVNHQSSATMNVSSQYLTSESIARSSFQKPQNTYMIHPNKYQQAFSSTKSNKSLPLNIKRKSNKGNKIINSEVMPIPMIKPHRHGATLGFNLPDQGLTLYLDINELATKPMAQNIGLKVVAHNKKKDSTSAMEDEEDDDENNFAKFESLNDFNENMTALTTQKLLQQNIKTTNQQQRKLGGNSPKKIIVKKAKFRYKMADSNRTFNVIAKNNRKKSNNLFGHENFISPLQTNNVKLSSKQHQDISNNNFSFNNRFKTVNRSDIPPSASRIPTTYTSQTHLNDEYEVELDKNTIQQKEINYDNKNQQAQNQKVEREIISFGNEDEDDDSEDQDSDIELPLNFDPNDDEEEDDDPEEHNESMRITTEMPSETTTFWARETKNINYVNGQSDLITNRNTLTFEEKVKKQEIIDNELVSQMQTLLEKSAKLIDLSASTCAARNRYICNPCTTNMNSITSNTSTTVREIAQQLEANLILNEVPSLFESELQDFMDFSTSGYTIILPSNNAVQRLPPNLLKRWKQNIESFMLNSYLIEGIHTMETLLAVRSISTRSRMKLFINNPFNETFTINGQRVIYANQKASNNGLVHVIDGLLYPSSDKDIINTLKSCERFDGFVTLAEGTGFAETLKKDGPFTVFVPSNDALQKVPDSDLEVIRRNMTALKEFLMYHVAQGVYYSQDLMDGQFLPSILEGQFLQAGVRVDVCSRRLVEVNVSPLYRSDIPASNGVIHVVDWILKPDDRDWCNGIILPRR